MTAELLQYVSLFRIGLPLLKDLSCDAYLNMARSVTLPWLFCTCEMDGLAKYFLNKTMSLLGRIYCYKVLRTKSGHGRVHSETQTKEIAESDV
jgi:hypothetical protein